MRHFFLAHAVAWSQGAVTLGISGVLAAMQYEFMRPPVSSVVRWSARVLTLLLIAVFLAFVAGEPLESFRAIHLREWLGMTFLFSALGTMLLAWEWEVPFAVLSLVALAAFTAVVHMQNYTVVAILALPNILYLVDWKLKRTHPSPISNVG